MSIQPHQVRERTRCGSDSKSVRNFCTAATLSSRLGYTFPSIHRPTSSNTRSAGFSSGLYGGSWISGRPNPGIRRSRWLGAPSHPPPADRNLGLLLQTIHRSPYHLSLHRVYPGPMERRRPAIHHQKQVQPFIDQLETLAYLHTPASPDSPHHAAQPYPHLIGEAKGCMEGHPSFRKPESTEGRPWGQSLKKPSGAPLNLG